jgi:hypothetical protein
MKQLFATLSKGHPIVILAFIVGARPTESSFADELRGITNPPIKISTNDQSKVMERVKSQPVPVLPVETAFSKGFVALGGRIDIHDPQGWVKLCRTETNCWVMTVHRYPGQDTNAIRIIIKDNGTAELRDSAPGAIQSRPNAKIPSPRAAFLKAIRSLKGRVDFVDPNGQIMFKRTRDDEKWLIQLSGYKGFPINGLMLSVSNDMRVTEFSAP